MKHKKDKQKNVLIPLGLSRRDFLARSAGTTAGLYTLTLWESSPAANAQSFGGAYHSMLRGAPPAGTQQLPFLGDLAGWDKPEYYETLHAGHRRNGRAGSPTTNANFFSDNRDALLIRGPAGVLVNHFDPGTGQWMQAPDGPSLTDVKLWNQPQYYSTIQSADIDGDEITELVARSGDGIEVWKYDPIAQQWNSLPTCTRFSDAQNWNATPAYYSTIQLADVDGDNVAEIVARGGAAFYVWKYNTGTKTWGEIAELPDLSDGNAATKTDWSQPQYYSTIVNGDLDGDRQEEVIARSSQGILAWSYNSSNPLTDTFDALPAGPAWSDAAGWNQPQYYSTIQTAYLGLGQSVSQLPIVSLVGRGPNGLEVWTYGADAGLWQQISFTNAILTEAPWNNPECYSTIQFADIDGDGIQELLARSPQGLVAAKVQDNHDGTYSWVALPNGPAWSDANGWNQVQYYSTIQTANSLQDGDPGYSGGSAGFQSVVLARNKDYVETWTYNPTTQSWSQTTNRAYPAFTDNQLTAYNYITTALGIQGTGGVGIRARYNNETGVLQGWIDDLLGSGIHPVRPPANVSADDWNAVKTQILNELTWVKDVQYWYGTLVHGQIVDTFLGEQLTIYTIGPYFNYSSTGNSNVTLALSIVALIAGALGAVLGLPVIGEAIGVAAGTAASIAGVMSNTFSAAALAFPGQGGSFQADYSQLQQQLANGFDAALTKLGTQLFAMTGGGSGASYFPGDYGLLSAFGQMIESTLWNWPTDTTALTAVMQRGYAIEVWKSIFNAYQATAGLGEWGYIIDTYSPTFIPSNYPTSYAVWYGPYQIEGGDSGTCNHWFGQGYLDQGTFPPADTLHAGFDPPVEGQVFPLGIPAGDLFQGINGWPSLNGFNIGLPTPPVNPPHKLPALGVDLHSSVKLTRNSDGTILVIVALINRGLTAASNLEITTARLNVRKSKSILPTRRTHLKPGKTVVLNVTFPNLPKGAKGILYLSGRYQRGTFGGNFRVTLP